MSSILLKKYVAMKFVVMRRESLRRTGQIKMGQIKKVKEINPHRSCLSSNGKSIQLLHFQIVPQMSCVLLWQIALLFTNGNQGTKSSRDFDNIYMQRLIFRHEE